MALFTDTFDGADGTTFSGRTGWTLTPGFTDVLKLDGAGAVKSDAYGGDPKSIINDTGGLDHYVEVVVGAAFVGTTAFFKVNLGASQTGRTAKFGVSYNGSTGQLRLMGRRDGTDQTMGTVTTALAAGDTLRIEQDNTALTLVVKINGTAVFTESNTTFFNETPSNGVGLILDFNGNAALTDIIRNFESNTLGGGDTTAPTLTSATGTATGSTTASGSVTTDEANGTLYRLASTNATETAATVIAAALSQTVTATGAQAVSFTGLTASTTYYAHYVHVDAAANESTRVSSASFTTDTPDTTAPTLSSPTATALSNALIAAGVTTNEANGTLYVVATTSATTPSTAQIRAGQDHTGAAAAFADDQVISSTGAKTFNVTGLTQLTLYYLYFHHQDAAANNSTVSSASATTFRNGATAQSVIDDTAAVGGNPAGVLYALALTLDPDDWMAYREISAPDPAGGTLTPNANGSFTYVGPEPADWVIQPEVNGVDHADGTITVALYQTIVEDTTAPTLTLPTGAALGSAGAAGSVTTDEANGTLYWLTTINATETDAAIKAGSSQAVTATGVQFVTSSGLTASTLYYNHFLHRDAAGNDSARSTSASFTTAAPGAPVEGSRPGEKTMHSCMKPAMYPAMNKG